MIVGVTGTNGAGKGSVVDYLVEKKGFKHYSVRGEIIAELTRRGEPVDRPRMGEIGNELREKNGSGYFIDLFIEQATRGGVTDIVIESMRSLGEVDALKARGGVLISIDADTKSRYDRIVERGSSTDKVDFEIWVQQEQNEWHHTAAHDMDVPGVMAKADYALQNNGTLEELHMQIDEVLKKIMK